MAEIGIERRRRTILPWIVGLLVLALVAFLLLRFTGRDGSPPVQDPVTDTTTVMNVSSDPALGSGI